MILIFKEKNRKSRLMAGVSKVKPYCQFVLYKEGKDTISCIQLLSRFLK